MCIRDSRTSMFHTFIRLSHSVLSSFTNCIQQVTIVGYVFFNSIMSADVTCSQALINLRPRGLKKLRRLPVNLALGYWLTGVRLVTCSPIGAPIGWFKRFWKLGSEFCNILPPGEIRTWLHFFRDSRWPWTVCSYVICLAPQTKHRRDVL